MNKYIFIVVGLCLFGCATLPPPSPVNPNKRQVLIETGFSLKLAMSGDWYLGEAHNGLLQMGQKPMNDGSTKIGLLMQGVINPPKNKTLTNKEVLKSIEDQIVNDSKQGRTQLETSKFTSIKHKNSDCLFFEQVGTDTQTQMKMNQDGFVCLHPKKPTNYVYFSLSHRTRAKLDPVSKDVNVVLASLEYE